MSITRIGGTFHVRRRVPTRFAGVEPRPVFKITLRTDSESEARSKAEGVWKAQIAAWEAKLAGNTEDAEAQFDAARALAQSKGFRYLPSTAVASLDLEEVVRRIEAISFRGGKPDLTEARALLGGAPKPKITISRALELYWSYADDKTLGKSVDQIRRWKNPRIKAIRNFIEVVGDIGIDEITADDAQLFREWWLDRIRSQDLTANSANKDFVHVAVILRTVDRAKRLGLSLPLGGMSFAEEKAQRLAFSEKWLSEKIVGSPKLMGLNPEARAILLGMINTGYRPSEGASLGADQIRLDSSFPHISIEPNGRELKTATSRRIIPLAGVSLEAFKEFPAGFPRYHDNPSLSATVNKFMRENGLMETLDHTMYGLRHSFEDRMLDRDVDERIRRDLMGHSLERERYGKGASPQKLLAIVKSVAL